MDGKKTSERLVAKYLDHSHMTTSSNEEIKNTKYIKNSASE